MLVFVFIHLLTCSHSLLTVAIETSKLILLTM